MKAIARQKLCWPSIDMSKNMSPLLCRYRIHFDYAKTNGKDVLVLMGSGSKWIEAATMSSTSTEATLKQLFSWFTRLGFPRIVHSDNGPQFNELLFLYRSTSLNGGRTPAELQLARPVRTFQDGFIASHTPPLLKPESSSLL
ncbi:unnamed protein product [Lepeophtheirus salmonis]|uniref:(salmon louse) hypothetical protein n=1 Tax=Lepeophtheirus salmonis TaxID=72036 RepID=A0A7R8H8G5_LEPSM|nr:unnamed protein product [Lepeophtheirus salmonis]CAF2922476.1 unnamed protein product [Lepeophtheirus salmonis]